MKALSKTTNNPIAQKVFFFSAMLTLATILGPRALSQDPSNFRAPQNYQNTIPATPCYPAINTEKAAGRFISKEKDSASKGLHSDFIEIRLSPVKNAIRYDVYRRIRGSGQDWGRPVRSFCPQENLQWYDSAPEIGTKYEYQFRVITTGPAGQKERVEKTIEDYGYKRDCKKAEAPTPEPVARFGPSHSVFLSWQPTPGDEGDYFRIQVFEVQSEILLDSSGISILHDRISSLVINTKAYDTQVELKLHYFQPNKSYYWRVRAENENFAFPYSDLVLLRIPDYNNNLPLRLELNENQKKTGFGKYYFEITQRPALSFGNRNNNERKGSPGSLKKRKGLSCSTITAQEDSSNETFIISRDYDNSCTFLPKDIGLEQKEKRLMLFFSSPVLIDQVLILDEWGKVMYFEKAHSTIPEEQFILWNLSTEGQPAPPGNYYYFIQYREKKNGLTQTARGNIAVSR